MNRFIAGIAATGFVLSAIVHGVSIMGVDLSDVAPVWGLHFGIFILIVPVAISGWRRPATRPTVRAILMALPVWV